MNRAELAFHRILVALDTAQLGSDALLAAAELASQLQAELAGLFIEDTNLLRLASLPFAQEICCWSATQRPLDLASMEQALRSRAREVRESVASIARQENVPWSFAIRRGSLLHVTLEAGEDADLLVLRRSELSAIGSHPASASTSRRAHPMRPPKQPILALYDGTPSGKRALLTGVYLADERKVELIVLLSGHPHHRQQRLEEAKQLVNHAGTPIHFAPQTITEIGPLIEWAKTRHCSIVLMNRHHELLDAQTTDMLLKGLDCPLAVVR